MIDRIVRNRERAMPALVPHFEAKVDYVLLAHLQVIRYFLVARGLAPSSLVQRQFGINQVAVILQQPSNSVVGAPTLFVRRERDNYVSIRLESFPLVPDQVCDPDCCLRFVIAGPTSVKEPILLDKLKGIC